MALVINGERIDDAVLDGEFSGIKAYFESLGNVSCCERNDEFRGYARQNVVARVLLAQEAMRAHPPVPDTEIEQAIDKLKEEHGGEQRFFSAIVPSRLRRSRVDLANRSSRVATKTSPFAKTDIRRVSWLRSDRAPLIFS